MMGPAEINYIRVNPVTHGVVGRTCFRMLRDVPKTLQGNIITVYKTQSKHFTFLLCFMMTKIDSKGGKFAHRGKP